MHAHAPLRRSLGAPGVRLLDTPGPNEYGQEPLRYRVERLLEGVDAVGAGGRSFSAVFLFYTLVPIVVVMLRVLHSCS